MICFESSNININLSGSFFTEGNIKASNTFSLEIGDELHRTKYSRIHADTVELTLPKLDLWEADTVSADTLLKINVDEFNLSLHAGEIRVDGAIKINSEGDITNAGPLISRNYGINLKGHNISNNSEMLAAGFININAIGNENKRDSQCAEINR